MPARKSRKSSSSKRSKRSTGARGRKPAPKRKTVNRKPRKASPEAIQRRMDLGGIACLGLAVYLGYVFYLGANGGRAGNSADVALSWAVGAGAMLAPVALAIAGLMLLLRPILPASSSLAAGSVAVAAGLLLALAAQTAGLGPDTPVRRGGIFEPDFFTEHGGALGEVLYWATTTIFQRLGAHITTVVLIAGGVLVASGRSVADLVSWLMRGADGARRGASDFATAVRETGMDDPDLVATNPEDTDPIFGPPEPVSSTPVIRRLGGMLGLDGSDEDDDDDEFPDFDDAVVITERAETDDPEEAETRDFQLIDGEAASEEPVGDEVTEPGEPVPGEAEPEEEPVYDVTPMGAKRSSVTESEEIDYTLPSDKVLQRGKADRGPSQSDHEAVARQLLEALGHFGIEAKLVGVVSGPHVSRYELRLAPGTKVSKITQLKDDLAYALASTDIRILAPIPGKQAVGVEVPNQRRRIVRLGDIYGGRPEGASPLLAWLGKDISGRAISTDLQRMPHVLVAGTTGSGKSGSVNAILSSLLLHASPNELRLVLVDPKQVELNHYEQIPHLLTPVVTSPRMAANVLNNLLSEMESRYGVMAETRSRNLEELNKVRRAENKPTLPYILCVIDELADLMMVAPTEVEDAIIRLAQKSRAVGIHLLLATQRPSTDIITGTIKVNIPARIAFAVSSQVDSRVILDQGGAEALLGQGDMLFRGAGTSKLQRIQGAFVTEAEIAKITRHWAKQGEPEFDEELLSEPEPVEAEAGDDGFDPDQDDLLEQAAAVVVESGTASVSMIQRRMRVGYTRAGRLIDMLERRGIISGYEGSKPRQVLASPGDLRRLLGGGDAASAPETAPEAETSETGEAPAYAGGDRG